MPNLPGPKLSVGCVEAEARPSTACALKHYLASAGLYGLLMVVLALNPWFRGLLSIEFDGVTGMRVYGWLYLAYLGSGFAGLSGDPAGFAGGIEEPVDPQRASPGDSRPRRAFFGARRRRRWRCLTRRNTR